MKKEVRGKRGASRQGAATARGRRHGEERETEAKGAEESEQAKVSVGS